MAATAVTPTGVRDGDPDALAGLADVRGPAVLAYCEVVAGRGDRGAAAAAEAFGSFRAGVVVAGDLATLNPEALLISATRHAAARYASTDAPEACARVPGLLAARADRSISLADHDWLEAHLASCWTCRAPVARFNVADKAYQDPPDAPLPPAVKAAIVAAMTAAAPIHRETPETPAVGGNGYAAPPASTNGDAAYADPALPDEEPYTAYDLPALTVPLASGADQPTSAYEMPAADLDDGDPSATERRERRRTRERRSIRGRAGPATATATAAPDAAARGTRMARPRRELSRGSRRRPALRPAVVLPVALVVLAIIAALVIAGVFGGGEPASVPQSYAPETTDTPTSTQAAPVVVVPGTAAVSAAAVEKAKARARAAKKKAAAAAKSGAKTTAPTPAAADDPTPTAGATPLPPPPPPPAANTNANAKPKINAGNGATGAEQLPPAKDTSNVPELAPPVEPVAPPPG